MCNCPPSEVLWPCTEVEYRAVHDGSACEPCDRDATSLACRAHFNKMSIRAFCDACISQGLNDIGCPTCEPEAVTVTHSLGSLAVDGDSDMSLAKKKLCNC